MLTLFPSLLTFGIFAPFLLRLAAGTFFFLLGYRHFQARGALEKEMAPRLGSFAASFAVATGAVELLIGLALIAGFLTQVAAILALALSLKALWFRGVYPIFAPHEKAVYVLIAAISFSLLFSGAGAFAIDLPL